MVIWHPWTRSGSSSTNESRFRLQNIVFDAFRVAKREAVGMDPMSPNWESLDPFFVVFN